VVKVGDLIGVLALSGEDWRSVSVPAKAGQALKQPEVAVAESAHSSHQHDSYL